MPTAGLDQIVLPIMPATAAELDRVLAFSNSLNADIQRVLLTDPAAAIALLRALGARRPRACETLADLSHAVSMLGMERFRDLVVTLPVRDVGEATDGPHHSHAHSQAAHAAHYAAAIARRQNQAGENEVATAALLQQPAILALWERDPQAAARATNAARDMVPYDIAFGAELGQPVADLNRALAEAWCVPHGALGAMGDFNPFNHHPQIVRLADGIAQATALGWYNEDSATYLDLLAEYLHIERAPAETWLHREAVNAAHHLSGRDYPLAAYTLLLTRDEDDEDDEDIDHPIPEFGRRAEPRTAAAPDLDAAAAAGRAGPQAPQPAAAQNVHAMLQHVIDGMLDDAGVERALFLILNKERSRLRVRLSAGCGDDDPLVRLSLPMAQKHLFSMLMSKQQSLWMNPGNRDRYLPLLPKALHPLIAQRGFFAMSVFARGKPVGLYLADGRNLDATRYANFRTWCHRAADMLGGKNPGP